MEKIAIIGLSLLFPDAETPEQYWQNLIGQKDSTSKATAEQMGVDAEIFYAPGGKGTQDKYYCIRGGYIRDFEFDPKGYKAPPEAIIGLDDLFKWPLHVSRRALQDSGYWDDAPVLNRCGLILGNLSFPTKSSHHLFAPIHKQAIEAATRELLQSETFSLADLPADGPFDTFGRAVPVSPDNLMISGYPAAFASRALGLGGVNFALDAACASSLYAVKMASQHLLTGKADLMLAGAVSRADPFFINMGFSIFHAYPEDGDSSPLNRTSKGLVAGEGAGIFVLKRHSDALRDGDKIYAVISGVGLSNDGKGKFLLQPNPKGQILAFERAYANAGVSPKEIDYVECHATGTPVGDKAELNSMDAFFGKHQAAPLVGSAKSNFGHLLTAAGMAGMSKVILAMAHQQIPATINLSDPLSSKNNVISAEQMVKTAIPWPARIANGEWRMANDEGRRTNDKKRAAVSAFGFGGTNAHLILEEGEKGREGEGERGREQSSPYHPLTLSPPHPITPSRKLAIVGMDAFFGSCDGLEAFGRTIYEGRQHFIPVPPGRWQGIEDQPEILKAYGFEDGQAPQGAYITDFDMDFLHFKIPPNDDRPIPQQLLILKVADRALRDAGLKEGGNVAVIIASGAELALHRFRSRCDLAWQLEESLAHSAPSAGQAHSAPSAGQAKSDVSLSPEQAGELERIAKNSIHEAAQVNQYTSFIGNIMASRISAQWDFSGPSFTLSAEENSVFRALETAQMFLAAGEVDAVVVGAVDLAGGVENVLLRNQSARVNSGAQTMSVDQNANGWLIGEGAGAVVLKRHEDALRSEDRIYAVIDAISITQNRQSTTCAERSRSIDNQKSAIEKAFAETGLAPADIGYLELFGSGISQEDEAEIKGLTAAYQTSSPELSCAIGSVKANIGHTYTASGIASLIKTAHCLYHRYIPAVPQWSAAKMPEAWQNSSFYAPTESRTWFSEQVGRGAGERGRIAAINGLGADGSFAHLILSGEVSQLPRDNAYLSQSSFYLFPLAADEPAALLELLQSLQQNIKAAPSLARAARQSFEAYQKEPDAAYAIAILGRDKKKLLREIQIASSRVGQAIEKGETWKTPLGSYFTPKPLGKEGKVAFVYPGAFSSYPGLGRDLFHLFPQLHRSFTEQIPNPGELVGEKRLYPRSLNRLSKRELKELALELMPDSITMLQSGATFSTLVTTILRDQFKVQPQAALGYSLGEMTMMFALGVWSVRDNNSAHLRSSPLFKDRLSGPKNAVREYWGLPKTCAKRSRSIENRKSKIENPIWAIFVLKTSPANVKAALSVAEGEERVYLTHINTPQEVVIAGDPRACARVIQSLNCAYMQAPYSHVIHCEPMRSEYDEFVKLNTLPIANTPALSTTLTQSAGLDFYFAADDARSAPDSDTIARNIATAAGQQVDFPRLVQRAYDDGARIFIELGPRSACTLWIGDILSEQAFMAAAIDRRSPDNQTSLVKLLAQLVSHRVPMDLSPLYEPHQEKQPQKRSLVRTVSLTGKRIQDVILTEENRQKFDNLPRKAPPPPARMTDAVKMAPFAAINGGVKSSVPAVLDKSAVEENNQAPITPSKTKDIQMTDTFSKPVAAHFFDRQLQKLSESATRTHQAHSVFLRARQEGLQQISELMQLSLNYSKPETIIWDEEDLLNYAEGDIAPIFGEEYAIIDTYRRRVRLPMPPYLLVSRITRLQAQRGVYEASTMTTEYDIPFDAWYSTDGQIPWAVSVESGQCDLMLISYLGIDFENKGERVYRLLDCTLTFLEDMPLEGHTLRYDISIDSFAKSGDSLLFFFSYNCFVGDTMVLKMRGGCAGFFSDEELAAGKGIITSQREKEEKLKIPKQHFPGAVRPGLCKPLLSCPKTSFNRAELLSLSQGDIAAVFGPQYAQTDLNRSLQLPPEDILMVDRIVSVDPSGGAWGLGLIVSEKDLEPDHWYFPCHFKGDQVMAGSLVAEGCSQLLQFYLLYLGFQTKTQDARFQPMPNLPQVVRTRKQIMACSSKLTYRMEITEIGLSPHPYAKANVDIIFEGVVVVDFKNLGLQLTEKAASDPYKIQTFKANSPSRKLTTSGKVSPAIFNEDHIQEFAMGSISKCFGPDYEVFEGRRIPRTPNGDLKLISRIVEINAERFVFTGEPNLVSEYDVPADPWFCRHAPVTPYSILMEIALQPCGFLSAWLGSTLRDPDEDFYFRNLDGDGLMLKNIDVRGKTIVNRVKLLSSTAIQGIIIQKFAYQLECEGEAFYEGSAVFGYFQPQSLANQVGLDRGQNIRPWFEQEDVSDLSVARIDLTLQQVQVRLFPAAKRQWYQSLADNSLDADKPFYRLAGGQLNFLDEAFIIPDGGRHQQGYIYAAKEVDPQDWFFSCHFYQDPVMPGSLGVEAILQAMQLYALHQNLGAHLQSPHFTHLPDHKIVWVYRGQIIPDNDKMSLEIHISNVESSHNQVTLIGDASLWKDNMRIYEVKGIAIRLLSSPPLIL